MRIRKTAKEDAPEAQASQGDEVRQLQERVAALTAENLALRERVAELEAQLH